MTENEFRDALRKCVGHTGLSSERQINVLAQMKGDEPKVKTSNKLMIALALVLALTMGMNAAVAAGLGGVDWNGDPALPPDLTPLEETEHGSRMNELFAQPGYGVIQCLVAPEENIASNGVMNGLTVDFFSESLEEMEAWVKGDGSLPWPAKLPEGYTIKLGRAGYMCGVSGGLNEISNEITEDGYMQIQYELPPENRFMSNYFLSLANEAGEEIVIHVQSEYGNYLAYTFFAGEGSKVTTLEIEGVSNALFIESPDQLKLALRRPLAEPKSGYYMDYLDYYIMGQPMEWTQNFENIVIVINATDLTENDLLDIFGLTAK